MLANRPKISAVIITYNEMQYIKDCIASAYFADEIIVVDSFSTDGTAEFLQNHKRVVFYQKAFENFTKQKTFALSKATHNWVYFFDADEKITPALQQEILETIANPNAKDAYYNKRLFMFKNKRVYFSGTQTDKQYRLFKKDKCHFAADKLVHEVLQVAGSSGVLKHKLIHYSYKNYQDFKGKLLKYARLKAKEEFRKGKRFSYPTLIIKVCWKFCSNYFLRLGILDGKKGFILCYLNTLGIYHRYQELKLLAKKQ